MLFDFQDTVTVAFQMTETLVPLSIAFISGDGTIMDIQDMEPLSKRLYPPAVPYRSALEVNQGYFRENGITVGDKVEFQPADHPDYVIAVFHLSPKGQR